MNWQHSRVAGGRSVNKEERTERRTVIITWKEFKGEKNKKSVQSNMRFCLCLWGVKFRVVWCKFGSTWRPRAIEGIHQLHDVPLLAKWFSHSACTAKMLPVLLKIGSHSVLHVSQTTDGCWLIVSVLGWLSVEDVKKLEHNPNTSLDNPLDVTLNENS